MTINLEREKHNSVVLTITGKLDTTTALQLERKIKLWDKDIIHFTLNFLGVDYISSSGLLVLLHTHKLVKSRGGKLTIKNMDRSIRETFEMTNFVNLMLKHEKFVMLEKEGEDNSIILTFIGEIDIYDIPDIKQAFSRIKKAYAIAENKTRLILDMEKLTYISVSARKHLKGIIREPDWSQNNLEIRNTCTALRLLLEMEEMGTFISTEHREKKTAIEVIYVHKNEKLVAYNKSA